MPLPGGRLDCFHIGFGFFAANVDAQSAEKAHVDVGNPHSSKEAKEISPPVVEQQLEVSEPDKEGCDVMAETVFAGEEIEEFSLQQ